MGNDLCSLGQIDGADCIRAPRLAAIISQFSTKSRSKKMMCWTDKQYLSFFWKNFELRSSLLDMTMWSRYVSERVFQISQLALYMPKVRGLLINLWISHRGHLCMNYYRLGMSSERRKGQGYLFWHIVGITLLIISILVLHSAVWIFLRKII